MLELAQLSPERLERLIVDLENDIIVESMNHFSDLSCAFWDEQNYELNSWMFEPLDYQLSRIGMPYC